LSKVDSQSKSEIDSIIWLSPNESSIWVGRDVWLVINMVWKLLPLHSSQLH